MSIELLGLCDPAIGTGTCSSFTEGLGSMLIYATALFVAFMATITIWRLIRLAWAPVVTRDSLAQDLRSTLHHSKHARHAIRETAADKTPDLYY